MIYAVIKSLHLISVVSWFAAMLYGVRLLVYQSEALDRSDSDSEVLQSQFSLMSRRLWRGIGNPAMVSTVVFGTILMIQTSAWDASWFQFKSFLLFGLFWYHGHSSRIRKDLELGRRRWSSRYLRVLNEVGTAFMVMIVFAAVTKSITASILGLAGFLLLAFVIVLLMRLIHVRRR